MNFPITLTAPHKDDPALNMHSFLHCVEKNLSKTNKELFMKTYFTDSTLSEAFATVYVRKNPTHSVAEPYTYTEDYKTEGWNLLQMLPYRVDCFNTVWRFPDRSFLLRTEGTLKPITYRGSGYCKKCSWCLPQLNNPTSINGGFEIS